MTIVDYDLASSDNITNGSVERFGPMTTKHLTSTRLRTNIDSSPDAVALPLTYCLGKARSTLMLLHERLGLKQSFNDVRRVAEDWVIENKRSAVDLEDVYAYSTSKMHAWVSLVIAMAYLREAELASSSDEDKSWNALMAIYFFIGINTGSAYEFIRKGNATKKGRADKLVNKYVHVLDKICPDKLWASLTDAYNALAVQLLTLDGVMLGADEASIVRYDGLKDRLVERFKKLASGKNKSEAFRAKLEECCRETPRPGRKPSATKKSS